MNKISYTENLSKNYNTYHGRHDKLNEMQIYKIQNYLNLNTDKKVMDVGCGSGRLLVPMSTKVDEIIGVEYSPNMFNELKTVQPKNSKIYNTDYNLFLENNSVKLDSAYFSYSLHQLNENVDKQIDILKNTFTTFGVDKILLITISHKQMDENILNIHNEKLNKFDKNRFITKDKLQHHFNIELYEEETNYYPIEKNVLLDRIKNKYISSLQILDESEINTLISVIDKKYQDIIIYPDFYNYIVITNKN